MKKDRSKRKKPHGQTLSSTIEPMTRAVDETTIIPQLAELTLSEKTGIETEHSEHSIGLSTIHGQAEALVQTALPGDNDSAPDTSPQDTLLEVISTPDRGLAVFTTRKIKAGTLILVETPLITLDKHEEDDHTAIEGEFSRLRGTRSLSETVPQTLRRAKVPNCYNCESFKSQGTGGSALGLFASRFNHSCVPNAQFCYDERTNEMRFHAIRDIPRGKEVTSNYDKVVFESRAKRQRKQQIYYGFVCRCEACEPKTEFWARSDERRQAMYDAFRAVQACEHQFSAGNASNEQNTQQPVIYEALTALGKLEELLLKESVVGVPLANTYRSMAKWAERKHDLEQARNWKRKEKQACIIGFGHDAPRTKEIEQKLVDLETVIDRSHDAPTRLSRTVAMTLPRDCHGQQP
ncbi:hypothetical protein LTR10_014813 [Elasticomyces elasticus]|uniref:SET domain-containing protein n=1 Tax=Exophiala sideris TaxID=1016849 RepID=A0ABR0JGT2_9EURO|nr:hypothetical protein LTR10_014813 [Elasticomyces elasticus]KAK5025656.1 hypothetical protein LTS07_007860 [Exophiala sideris]KAK5033134.1 hypothetical protein LTR13_007099 [Exophiala sideris]KAK5063619.1 hypothetical protein LTR69_004325 [Exophiala sideris]KAK5180547.1 hypothetical protein LTR44_006861 [Eurotiomycetes sp. CCFEE 6388]